ncbi:MAG TPA: hypothetical protein VFI31_30500 [Pirellulales bacterium]|nr:hypothetical protein [Pirellulales bacterium]
MLSAILGAATIVRRTALWSAAIYRRFGLRRSRFLFIAIKNRHDERKVAPRPAKAAINRRTPKE